MVSWCYYEDATTDETDRDNQTGGGQPDETGRTFPTRGRREPIEASAYGYGRRSAASGDRQDAARQSGSRWTGRVGE